jgi:hypothetical protein
MKAMPSSGGNSLPNHEVYDTEDDRKQIVLDETYENEASRIYDGLVIQI